MSVASLTVLHEKSHASARGAARCSSKTRVSPPLAGIAIIVVLRRRPNGLRQQGATVETIPPPQTQPAPPRWRPLHPSICYPGLHSTILTSEFARDGFTGPANWFDITSGSLKGNIGTTIFIITFSAVHLEDRARR
jgi:hypothetical protein